MCGLVGVVTKKQNGFSKDHQDVFSTLLFVDTLRGKDSTGVFVVSNEGDAFVAKDKGMAPAFMTTNEYDDAMKRAWSRGAAMIGHNRAATRGSVNDQNAHPFNVDNNIILVHNGTMRSDHKQHADVEVDSHAIAHLIHEKETVAEALGAFYGAYALIWYNIKEGKLNMIRNHERPLFWMELDDAWVWCSEKSMLEFAANRVNVKVKTEPTMLPEDTLQTFTLEDKRWKVSAEKLDIKKSVHQSIGSGNVGGRSQVYYDAMGWEDYGYDAETAAWMFGGAAPNDGPPFRQAEKNEILSPQEWHERQREAEWEHRRRNWMRNQNRDPEHQPQVSTVQLLPAPRPQQQQDRSHSTSRMVEAREPVAFAGNEEREREMAIKLNKIIPYGQYTKIVLRDHPFNTSIHCAPFEYAYANGRDPSDGYYLYASPFDDEDIILRHWYPSKGVTEERMIQLAGCEYVFEFTLQQREWHPTNPRNVAGRNVGEDEPGYCIIRCAGAKIISTGSQQKVSH